MKHVIFGLGEVGKAINAIFPEAHSFDPKVQQSRPLPDGQFEILHVCFPYHNSIQFHEAMSMAIHKVRPRLIIIHSSVPIGTSQKYNAIHSPIRGVHPNLEKGIRTFVKYFGGEGEGAEEAAELFSEKGIKVRVIKDSRTTEAGKLWDTTQYGVMILLEKEIHKFCLENNLDFDLIYTDFNNTYNAGYTELDMPYVVRPFLKHMDGPIGGHCVVENAALLDTGISKFIIDANIQLKN